MNKKKLILLVFMPAILFAQKTEKVVDKKMNETFYVLKSDSEIKHGDYKKYSRFNSNKLLVYGYYKQGVKDSVWSYFDFNGELTFKYDYTKNELLFHKPNENDKNTYKVIIGNSHLDATLSRPPVFLGGETLMANEISYPIEALEDGKSGKVIISFIVDKSGKATFIHAKNPIGYGMDEEVIRVLKLMSDNWLPGILNGEPVDVEVNFPFVFRLQ